MPLKAVAEVLAGGVQQPVMSPERSESGTKMLSQRAHLSWQACLCACLPESADAAVWQVDALLYFDQTALQWRLSEVGIFLYFWKGHQFSAPFPDLRIEKGREK